MVERLIKMWKIFLFSAGIILGVFNPSFAEEQLPGQATQFFIKLDQAGIRNSPKEVAVFSLDSYGLIDESFEGLKKVSIGVKEIGGKRAKSFNSLPEELEFKKGRAFFFIEDSELETLELSIVSGKNKSPFPARITFKEKSVPDHLEIDLVSRGNVNEPQKATVLVLDKEGNLAIDYNQRGLNITVEELGLSDKSFTLNPQKLDISEGEASFSITNSEEEEELLLQLIDPQGAFKPIEASITFSIPDQEPPQIIDIKMETLAFVEMTFSEELDDGAATDTSNYEVFSGDQQTPRSVEFHGDRVILELDDLLRSYTEMYVEVRDLKDLAGNEIERDTRSPDYSVPYVPLSIELSATNNPAGVNTSVTVTITTRCTSGRIAQFVNAQFDLDVNEAVADNSFTLSSPGAQMANGQGQFTISNSTAEALTITVSDPHGEVDQETINLQFN
ncbi:hypothetical protein ACFL1I_02770 [Candidatus Omnitrophota bacterium]